MNDVVAILTAAGSGTRLGCEGPKALVMIDGVTLLRRAAAGLAASGAVDRIVVTAPAEDLDRFAAEVEALAIPVTVVAGSPLSRQASVARGLEAALAAAADASVVLVHDAARALTPPEVTARVVDAVRAGCGAVVPALPVTDTVKEVDGPRFLAPAGCSGGAAPGLPDSPMSGASTDTGAVAHGELAADLLVETVVATPDRTRLRAVQTPQGFATDVLLRAHRLGLRRADDEALAASDDAALVEALGEPVAVVPGDPMSLKVTTPLDLALAELLAARS